MFRHLKLSGSTTPADSLTKNAIALTLSSATRAVTPASATSIFAIGVGNQFLSGYLIWVIMVAMALVGTVVVWCFVDDLPGEGRWKKGKGVARS